MHRREAVKNVAFLLGGALSATTIAAVIEGCTRPQKADGSKLFTADQEKLITEIADIIIPTTKKSPGAKAAGVGPFIPMMLNDCYPEDAQKEFVKGLEDIEKRSKDKFNKSFLELDVKERETIIAAVREQTIADMAAERKLTEAAEKEAELKKTKEKDRPGNPKAVVEQPKNKSYFFAMARDLTMLGFFTSEIGATQAYEYVEIPGRYDGCTDLKPGQRVWA